MEFRVEVVVEPDEDGFHAFCPALKGLHTCGSTEQEAVENARDAAIAYIESLMKHHEPIPVGIPVRVKVKEGVKDDSSSRTSHTEELQIACAI